MFTKLDDFLSLWKQLSDGTGKFMDSLTDESLSQEINNDHRTLGRIAFHIAQTIGEMMEKTGLKLEGPGEKSPLPSTAAEIRDGYKTAAGSLYKQIENGWTDETLLIEDDLYGQKWSKGRTLRILIDHEIHHRGQMTVLMRQAGLKVPGLYGPSKEEWSQYGQKEPEI
jgi:uncharacterized damage-inducible protein DinB